MITRDDVERRLQDLRQQQQRAETTLLAVSGAIQDCEYWLGQIAQREAAEAEKTNGCSDEPAAPAPS